MAEYCIKGYLDEFVNPDKLDLPSRILTWLQDQKKMTHKQIWQAIQASDCDASIKSLEERDIQEILEWMHREGKIGKPEIETITYSASDENVRGIENPKARGKSKK